MSPERSFVLLITDRNGVWVSPSEASVVLPCFSSSVPLDTRICCDWVEKHWGLKVRLLVRQSHLLWFEVICEVAPKLVHVPRDALKNASNVGFDEVLALFDRKPQVPWEAPGWFFEISLWLDGLGLTDIEWHTSHAFAAFVHAKDPHGKVYCKAGTDFRPREGLVAQFLSDRCPHRVPEVVAANPEREWLVTRAVPERLLAQGISLSNWEKTVKDYADFQRESESWTAELLALGVPKFDLETLERSAMEFLSDAATLRHHGLKEEAIERLLDVVSRIPSWVERLSRQNIPLTLIHGDFHPMNVFWTPTGPKYFDWSDACIAHPWLDAGRLFNWTFLLHKNAKHFKVPKGVSAYNRLKRAHLAAWGTTDEGAFECARLLSALFHAIRGDLFLRKGNSPDGPFVRILLSHVLELFRGDFFKV